MFATLYTPFQRLFSYTKVSQQLDPLARANLRNNLWAAFFEGVFMGGALNLLPYVAKKFANASDLEVEWLFKISAIGMASAVFVPMLLRGLGKVRQRVVLLTLRNIVVLMLPVAYLLTVHGGAVGEVSAGSDFNFWLMAITLAAAALSIAPVTSVAGLSMEMYPDSHRMQCVGCVSQVQIISVVGANALVSRLLDISPSSFWWLFPLLTLPSFIGHFRFFARLRSPVEESGQIRFLSFTLFDILRGPLRNRRFWLYQLVFALGGLPNLMAMPLYLILISGRQTLYLNYMLIGTISVTVPAIATMLTVSGWARVLDRWPNPFVGRGLLMVVWTLHPFTYAVAALLMACMGPAAAAQSSWMLGLLLFSGFLAGTLNAGGSLNWLLGSTYFAPSGEAAMYSGAHMVFNATRAFFGPMLGMGLYVIFNRRMAAAPWQVNLFGHAFAVATGFLPLFLIATGMMAAAAVFQFVLRWHYGPMPLPAQIVSTDPERRSEPLSSVTGGGLPVNGAVPAVTSDAADAQPGLDADAARPSRRLAPLPLSPGGSQ
ncbi:MAG: hypothetical protein ACREJ2_10155 [Planctomycetota bacterium]